MDATLTDRQLRFIFEYLKDQNASAAAVRAGYAQTNRAAQAHALMNNPAVQERLRLELQSLLAEAGCSMLELIKERKRAAFFHASKMFTAGWELAAPDQMEEETRAALEVRTVLGKSGLVVHLRQPDRDRALRALERVHERLDALNERHWARLEKQGRLKSLDEIEAMDGGDVSAAPASDFSGKPMVFSGSNTNVVEPAIGFREKAMGLSGSALPQPQASPWLLQAARAPAPAWAQLRAA